MSRSTIVLAAIGCVLAGAISGCGSDDRGYHVGLVMRDANGLRDGAEVALGGVAVGRVELRLAPDHRRVLAELQIDAKYAPLDRHVRVAVSSVNLLGLKRADLLPPARPSAPAPSGHVLRPSQLIVSTDLDQVLDVLDPDTRTALAVLVNEAGAAVAGRRTDLAQLVAAMPHSFVEATRLLDQVAGDTHTLKQLLTRSDRFIGQVTRRRHELSQLVRTLAGTGTTVAARHAELRATLRRAPSTLTALRRFLDELRTTAASLGPAARDISAVTPALSATLAELRPFQRVAAPTLRQATAVAPQLTDLARRGGPVLHRAVAPMAALKDAAGKLIPVSATLDDSADNIIAIVENWSRAIQFRDGLSHIFRGEATVTANLLTGYIDRLAKADQARVSKAPAPPKARPAAVAKPPATSARPHDPGPTPAPLPKMAEKVTDTVKGILDAVLDPPPPSPGKTGGADSLLDFLLKP